MKSILILALALTSVDGLANASQTSRAFVANSSEAAPSDAQVKIDKLFEVYNVGAQAAYRQNAADLAVAQRTYLDTVSSMSGLPATTNRRFSQGIRDAVELRHDQTMIANETYADEIARLTLEYVLEANAVCVQVSRKNCLWAN